MRNSMAEFRGHLESYDAQLADVKRDAGDATLKVTKVDEKVQVLQGNVTSLKSTLSNVQSNHRETVDNLDLLTTVSFYTSICISCINSDKRFRMYVCEISDIRSL